MELEELKTRISDRYNVEELCEILDITVDDLVDKFLDLVYDNVMELDLDVGVEYEVLEDDPVLPDEWRE